MSGIDFKQNPIVEASNDPHLPCVLLVDTSRSMCHHMDSLNRAISSFRDSVCKNELSRQRVDVAVIQFNNVASIVQYFVPICDLPDITLKSGGRTAMGTGINMAIDIVKDRCQLYSRLGTPCFKPWIFMITDGSPWGEPKNEIEIARHRIKEEESRGSVGKLKFFAVAVDNAKRDLLATLTTRVIDLKEADFGSLFDWLADSMTAISISTVDDESKLNPLPSCARRYY